MMSGRKTVKRIIRFHVAFVIPYLFGILRTQKHKFYKVKNMSMKALLEENFLSSLF